MRTNKGFIKNREFKNASWLIFGRLLQMLLSFFISIFTTRYLGPSNYGLINYVSSFIAFFTSFCTLGLNSVIIKDFVDNPNDVGTAIGSTIVMRAISSILSAISVIALIAIIDNDEPLTIMIAILCSIALPFQVFDTINYWFQSQYNSKVTSIATLIAYVLTSIYKIVLLVLQKDVRWFAFATAIDYICVAIVLLVSYKMYKGPKMHFSKEKSRALIKKSYHYILSGLMVAIYGHTDKLMLKQMLNEAAVGYYSIASALCITWVFVLSAIIDSMYPTILQYNNEDEEKFKQKNRQLYAIVFYVSVFVSLLFVLLGDFVINIMYGEEFLPAAEPLKVITWYTAFSYLGVARNAWIVSKNKQKYLKYIYILAAILNVGLNFAFIPLWGATGAAVASLITQFCTSIGLPLLIKDLRPNAKLMLEAIILKGVFNKRDKEML